MIMYKNDLAQAGWSIVLSNKSDKEIILAQPRENTIYQLISGNPVIRASSGGITYAETK